MNPFQQLQLNTQAGHAITARLFSPANPVRNAICIIAPATGVAQYHYEDFAHWLSEQGYHVLTFDYEGMGLSVNGHVKHSTSDIVSWAEQDCPAVLDYVRQHFADAACIWIGHSVGGHLLGMMPDTSPITRAITIAAGVGTWWYNAAPTKRIVWFLWYVLVPATVPLLGYFPGNKLGLLCDMPKGVILQWRRWCLQEDYAVGYEGRWLADRYAAVRLPITAIEFSDDEMMSSKSLDKLHSFFTGAPVTRIVATPAHAGTRRIGHIGWSKKSFRTLWENIIGPHIDARDA